MATVSPRMEHSHATRSKGAINLLLSTFRAEETITEEATHWCLCIHANTCHSASFKEENPKAWETSCAARANHESMRAKAAPNPTKP